MTTSDADLRAVDLIARKRDGGHLDRRELGWLVGGYLDGSVAEGQMAAFLMAGVIRGFDEAEAHALTEVLVGSGETLDLSGLAGPTVDKHSTGGVADATTLLVAPLVASAGVKLVKLSGRGLGHTGGTLDKLESIPGLRTALDPDEMMAIAADVGCVVAAQTARLVPADKALYALRDVTGTVAAPALIASSIMAKKIAAGAGTIVLDVKAGDGAFLPEASEATALARLCVAIGTEAGRRTVALVTDMEQPLGRGVGNALEVAESVELLSRPPCGRLAEVAIELASLALSEARARSGGPHDLQAAAAELRRSWETGAALETLSRMVAAQGGDPAVCESPRKVLPVAPVVREIVALRGGTVTRVPARAVGHLAGLLGAGRSRADDDVDPAVGLDLRVEVGDNVEPGEVLGVVHARNDAAAETVGNRLRDLVVWADGPVAARPVVLDRVSAA